jgi:hypothetical protein
VILVLAAAVVVSHQLTPVTLMFGLWVFAVTGHTRYRRLWLIVALLFVCWFSYRASDFWVGQLGTVLGDLGRASNNFSSAVSSRVGGDAGYQLMQNLRLGTSLLYGVTGAVGWWLIRRRPEAVLVAGLTIGAGVLVTLGSYGGEVVIRSFVLASPMLAPLTAVALAALSRRGGWGRVTALAVALTAATLLVTATRGVNVSFERVTPDDLAAARAVHERLEPGDVIGTVRPTGALGVARIGEFHHLDMSEAGCDADGLECALERRPEFVVVSDTQEAWGRLRDGMPDGWTDDIVDELVDRGVYDVIYQGEGATALQLAHRGG